MYNPYSVSELAKDRQRELLREAQAQHLAKQARQGQAGLGARVMSLFGRSLAALKGSSRVQGAADAREWRASDRAAARR